jgi:hypothetical protein
MAGSTVKMRPLTPWEVEQEKEKAQQQAAFASWETSVEKGRAMKSKIDSLATVIDRLGNKEALSQLSELREIFHDHENSTSGMLASIPLRVRGPSEKATPLIHKVIYTTELLEHILSYLHNDELLVIQRVGRHFLEVVSDSTTLQRKLGFVADHTRPFSMTASFVSYGHGPTWVFGTGTQYCGIYFGDDGEGDTSVVPFKIQMSGAKTGISKRIGSVLICQPPVQRMSVVATCCSHTSGQPTEIVLARPGTAGLTIGDINETATRMMEFHSRCSNARTQSHDINGIVQMALNFHGSAKVGMKEPRMVRLPRLAQ